MNNNETDTICDQAHSHLEASFCEDEYVIRMMQFNGQQTLRKTDQRSLLEHLCRAIAGQQLSTKAAATIWGRVKTQQKKSELCFTRFASVVDADALRSCGLSNAKTKTILGLSEAYGHGLLNARSLRKLKSEQLITHLSQFWGVGRWTAEMTAIAYFEQADIWSEGDVGLQNALNALYGDKPEQKSKALKLAKPFRSYWSLHLWAALDDGFFKPR